MNLLVINVEEVTVIFFFFGRLAEEATAALQLRSLRIIRRFFGLVWEHKHGRRVRRSVAARFAHTLAHLYRAHPTAHIPDYVPTHIPNRLGHLAGVLCVCAQRDPSMNYSIPGVRQTSAQFQRVLMQRVICCDGSDASKFTPFDVVMLSQVD